MYNINIVVGNRLSEKFLSFYEKIIDAQRVLVYIILVLRLYEDALL